ncbi:formate dehydrogenase subunit gamma [Ottowia testudinis]|uniref:Formate dehydrogenase subunit gamma n=1 Tax=Ottowia testudinis TaxID=2816950 RepID=A0A975CHC0_9BURK|nr:formate dehydrogenase subunit gamma [Ottowia testudinis]QTD46400.1 formate dehydrogenase subunit gamma [Ottowia testudinis]
MKKLYIQRYTDNQRINHWLVVVLFGLAGFSGLALFHPNLFFLTQFFGGPQWTRIVHPYFGIGVFLLFLLMFIGFWAANTWKRRDTEWLKASPELVLHDDEEKMPPVGKYNAGQKLVFWSMTLCLLVLLVTGLLFWQAWFAESVPIALQRVAVVLHALAAFIMSLTAVVHIYAAIWVKGTLRAMTQGNVSAGWAKRHHLLWYRDKMEGAQRDIQAERL